MKYEHFMKQVNWGDTTAFVYDGINRFQFESGVINEDTFANVKGDTEIEISPIQNLPEVQEVMTSNWLKELEPANGVENDGYNWVKKHIGDSLVAHWQEESRNCPGTITTVYMLILPEYEDEEEKPFESMEAFADFINESGEWPADAEDIIVKCGWIPDTGKPCGVCHDDEKYIYIDDEDGKAIVCRNQPRYYETPELTYDVVFDSDTKSDAMGFHSSLQECKDFIDANNGNPNVAYFGDYKGGTVSVRCNETEEVVFSTEVL